MTATVRVVVKCPQCAEVRVRSSEVTLRECVDDETWSYRFLCPQCGQRVVAHTGRVAALGAISVGARLERWSLPAEAFEAHSGSPITLGDVLDLHELLLGPDWFEALAGTA